MRSIRRTLIVWLLGGLIANCAAKRWIARFDGGQHGLQRCLAFDFELYLASNAREGAQVSR